MPPNTKCVTRPGVFGNPFTREYLRSIHNPFSPEFSVSSFRIWLEPGWANPPFPEQRAELLRRLPELRGKNLACFCALDKPCHADILLREANK